MLSSGPTGVMSEFLYHCPCPACGSSDAGAIYDDGHFHCHKCDAHSFSEDPPPTITKMSKPTQVLGEAERLTKRKLSQDTCRLYKIFVHEDTLRCHYFDDKKQLVGTKVRSQGKKFSVEGGPLCLFGMNLFGKGKRVVITEGELDAASCYEAMPKWPMVSIPNGAQNAKKAVKQHLDYLQGFEEIVLFFDGDQAGQEAALECAQVLPGGRVKIASLGAYKDASEALQAGDAEAIRQAIWNAAPYRPDGIVAGNSEFLKELVLTPQAPYAHKYPWKGLQEKLSGVRYGELITITAGTGTGKSSFCRQLAASLMNDGETVGYLALEESNRRTALGLMSVGAGQALHLEGGPGPEHLEAIWRMTLADWKFFLFDGFGSYDPQLIYNRIEYLACGMDCKVIFLDHLSILLSGLDGDERRSIDQTMTQLRSLVEKTGITMFLVSHLKRSSSDKDSHEEGGRVTLGHLRGSQAIAQLSDAVIALERDQQDTEDVTTVRILKDRYNGQTGVACHLRYSPNTCRFDEDSFDAGAAFGEAPARLEADRTVPPVVEDWVSLPHGFTFDQFTPVEAY
jgi:twinkle protein